MRKQLFQTLNNFLFQQSHQHNVLDWNSSPTQFYSTSTTITPQTTAVTTAISNHHSLSNFTNSNSTTTTSDNKIDLEPILTSSLSFPLNAFFLLLLTGLIVFIVFFFMMKSVRASMKRNQQVMIGSVILLCLVQMASVVCRTLYDALNISMVTHINSFIYSNFNETTIIASGFDVTYSYNTTLLSTLEQAGITQGTYTAMHVFGALELFFALMNCVVMMLIMCFVDNVFLNTVRITSGLIYSKGVQRATIFVNTITILFSITLSMVIVLTCVILILNRLDIVEEYQNYFFVAGYLLFVIQILIQTLVSNVSALSLLKIITKTASNENKKKTRKPIIKVIVLEIFLVLCALMQIGSMAFAIAVFEWVYCSLFYTIFNNVGIILFACVAIALYHPIFTDTTKVLSDINKNVTNAANELTNTKQSSKNSSHHSNNKHSSKSTTKETKNQSIHQCSTVSIASENSEKV